MFLGHCGINIAGVLDIATLKEQALKVANVEVVEDNLFLCSNEGQKRLQELIVEHRLNRVVGQLQEFARPIKISRKSIPVEAFLKNSLSLMRLETTSMKMSP